MAIVIVPDDQATWALGLAALNPGDTLQVRNGIYNEGDLGVADANVTIEPHADNAAPVYVNSLDLTNCLKWNTGTTIDGGTAAQGIFFLAATSHGLTYNGAVRDSVTITGYVRVYGCGGTGIYRLGSSCDVGGDAGTRGPLVHDNTGDGITIHAGEDNTDLYNLLVWDNGGDGIVAAGAASTVDHCTIVVPGGGGDGVDNNADATPVRNSIIYRRAGAAGTGITEAAAGSAATYCCVYGFGTNYAGGAGTQCLTSDPLFEDAATDDFTLDTATPSPCLLAGDDIGYTGDVGGNSRPTYGGFDMGAWQRVDSHDGPRLIVDPTGDAHHMDLDGMVSTIEALMSGRDHEVARQHMQGFGGQQTIATTRMLDAGLLRLRLTEAERATFHAYILSDLVTNTILRCYQDASVASYTDVCLRGSRVQEQWERLMDTGEIQAISLPVWIVAEV